MFLCVMMNIITDMLYQILNLANICMSMLYAVEITRQQIHKL